MRVPETPPTSATRFTPQLQLETLFALRADGRILSTREPKPSRGPSFSLIRSPAECAWAVHAELPDAVAAQLIALAREERPTSDLEAEPLHAKAYMSLAGEDIDAGPAFTFPEPIPLHAGAEIVTVTDLSQIETHFRGWTADELPGCAPVLAVLEDGHAVSMCFSARRSDIAAEAGLETAAPFRGRGLGTRVTAAWARATRASGRLPMYSTSWSNHASRAVARTLRLIACASDWSVS